MSIFEIIGGVLLIFFGLAVVVSVTLQEHKTNLGGALGGSMNEGTYDRGRTKTMDAQLSMISKLSGIAMCVVALAVLAGHAVHTHDQTVQVMAFVGVGGLDLPGGGVMLTAAAAAVAQMVDKAVDAVADGSHQNQNNNDVCHKKPPG